MTARQRRGRPDRRLAALGGALLLVTALGWVLPLSLWRTPTNLPAGAPLVLILGQDEAGALAFAVPSVLLSVLWAAALVSAAGARGRGTTATALAVTALLLLLLVAINPGGTQDIYHNVADARLFWRYGVNPTLVPPAAYPADPFYTHVWGYTDLPSAYGPLWYLIVGLPLPFAGDGLVANLVGQKLLVGAFMFGTVALTALAVRAVAPERTAFAVVLTGWCPLLAFESAGNGHNDAVMAFFLAAALLAACRRAHVWVLPLIALSVLVKYTTALAGPVALVWLLRRPDVRRWQVAAAVALSLALALAAYAPMYAGRDTVAALARPGMTFILSPSTLVHGLLAGPLGDEPASALVKAVTGLAFLAVYGLLLWRTRGDARDLAGRMFDVLFAYLVLASWWFWPWYLTWLAPAAAVARGRRRPAALAVFAAGALLTYLYWWPDPPWPTPPWFAAYAAITALFVVATAVRILGGWRGRPAATSTEATTQPGVAV